MPKVVDEDDDHLYIQPDDGSEPIRMANVPGLREAIEAPTPEPQQYPWETWDEKQKSGMTNAVKDADLALNYRSAGMMAKPGARQAAEGFAARGLSPSEATQLARFKMYRETTGGDPEWQGPLQINAGDREPDDTPEEIEARGESLLSGSPDEKKKIVAEMNAKNARSRERLFDPLVTEKPAVTSKEERGSVGQALPDAPKFSAAAGMLPADELKQKAKRAMSAIGRALARKK